MAGTAPYVGSKGVPEAPHPEPSTFKLPKCPSRPRSFNAQFEFEFSNRALPRPRLYR